MRIPFILSLFGLLLLGTNGYAGDIDVEVDLIAPDDFVVEIELIGNDNYAVVRDHSAKIIGRQLVDLPDGLRGSALVDVHAQLVNPSVASDSCDDGEVADSETFSYSYRDGDDLVTVTVTYFYNEDGELLYVLRTEIRTPMTIDKPNAER